MKKYLGIVLAVLMILTLAACAPENPAVETPKDNVENNGEVVDPSPKTESKEVTLYFANNEYIETGDESIEKLGTEQRVVEYGDTSLEESIVRELIKGPENTEKFSTEIPSSAELIGVEVADGTVFVNFAGEGMYGGSLQETFTINQIVASLLALESVERVQFLIDGKKAESLMGHYSIEEPFAEISN